VGNSSANCGDGSRVALGSAAGLVPYQAVLYRDTLLNNDWWTYNGYIQDSFSRGRWRFNGGLRYDWQTSKFLGGCVAPSIMLPTLLPAQCEEATDKDSITGKKIQAFSNWSPRVSVTRDLFGNGKTQVHASGSYFYQTRITLADNLGGLATNPALTWGPNASSGSCSTTAGAPCWSDANFDGLVQLNELIGIPSGNSRFNLTTGQLTPTGNNVDPSAQLKRTREAIVGFQHELIPNLAVGVDAIYRKYDRGTINYVIGFQPGAPGFPIQRLYTGPLSYTDPVTGLSAPYYVVCDGCSRPSGVGNITMTSPNYEVYKGVDITATKRFSNRWQMQTALTIQDNPSFIPADSPSFTNPTAREFSDGVSTIAKYLFKAQGSYQFPWDINASANLNVYQGATRTLLINGPGQVYGGVNAAGNPTTITYGANSNNTIEVFSRDKERFKPTKVLDLGLQKQFKFRGGKNRVKVMLDGFNVFNVNTIQGYASNNLSATTSVNPNSIIPPRVFRFGGQINF
jgi:hypothetical protein